MEVRILCCASLGALLLSGAAVGAGDVRGGVVPPPSELQSTTLQRGDAYYHLMRARLAAAEGQGGEVLAELEEASTLEPKSAGLLAEGAALLQMLGKRPEAERMARRALEIEANQPGALRVLADLAANRALANSMDEASRDEAVRLYETLARDPAADDEIFAVLMRLKMHAGDRAGAIDAARRFAARRPGDPGAVRLLVQALLHDGRQSEALETLYAFIATDLDSEDLLPFAAELTRKEQDWGRLESLLARFLETHPESAVARGLHGESLLRLRRQGEAAGELERAMELAPGEPMIRLQLATAYGALGRLADAVALAQGLAAQFPDNPGIRAVLGEALARQGDVEGALDAFEEALRGVGVQDANDDGSGHRDEIRRSMAALLMGRKRYAEAAKALEHLEAPEDPQSLEVRGRFALLSGSPKEARGLAEELRTKGETGIAAMLEAEAWMRDGKVEKALEKFDEAVSLLGDEARARAADSLTDAGRTDLAEELLRRWVKSDPANAQARFRLGGFLERRGRMSEAEAELRESLRIVPDDAEVLNYLGYSFADRNTRLDEALTLINRALKIEPWNGAYLDSLGWVYFRLGRYQEAREPLERAARDLPWDPTVLEHLGDVYDRLGERERAESSWRRALEAGAESAEAIRAKIEGTRSSRGTPQSPGRRGDEGPLGAAAEPRTPSSPPH